MQITPREHMKTPRLGGRRLGEVQQESLTQLPGPRVLECTRACLQRVRSVSRRRGAEAQGVL